MLVLDHDYTLHTLTPKILSSLKSMHKKLLTVANWFYQDISCDKPKGMHYSNREWNRNSAFIMSQYELSHDEANGVRVNE